MAPTGVNEPPGEHPFNHPSQRAGNPLKSFRSGAPTGAGVD